MTTSSGLPYEGKIFPPVKHVGILSPPIVSHPLWLRGFKKFCPPVPAHWEDAVPFCSPGTAQSPIFWWRALCHKWLGAGRVLQADQMAVSEAGSAF